MAPWDARAPGDVVIDGPLDGRGALASGDDEWVLRVGWSVWASSDPGHDRPAFPAAHDPTGRVGASDELGRWADVDRAARRSDLEGEREPGRSGAWAAHTDLACGPREAHGECVLQLLRHASRHGQRWDRSDLVDQARSDGTRAGDGARGRLSRMSYAAWQRDTHVRAAGQQLPDHLVVQPGQWQHGVHHLSGWDLWLGGAVVRWLADHDEWGPDGCGPRRASRKFRSSTDAALLGSERGCEPHAALDSGAAWRPPGRDASVLSRQQAHRAGVHGRLSDAELRNADPAARSHRVRPCKQRDLERAHARHVEPVLAGVALVLPDQRCSGVPLPDADGRREPERHLLDLEPKHRSDLVERSGDRQRSHARCAQRLRQHGDDILSTPGGEQPHDGDGWQPHGHGAQLRAERGPHRHGRVHLDRLHQSATLR